MKKIRLADYKPPMTKVSTVRMEGCLLTLSTGEAFKEQVEFDEADNWNWQ